ncbi:hypothetical protein ER308_12270 [Egibacter rhizosphaerae]|uniref:HprK-related kinase A n=1 Tax=Egibacter rhizosphaerae TaxID=1670831 RepID=A0A411YG66_9ACTN|nr:hypothetical protein [Egibacter rhizosphaerae]QBI20264.1 hypothetical protein ER308_12270 [Egibacter rhizosphaerae]
MIGSRAPAKGRAPGGWHETRRLRALAHDFSVASPDHELIAHLDRAFGALAIPDPIATSGQPAVRYELRPTADGRAALHRDGEVIERQRSMAGAVAMLLWHVNRRAVEDSSHLVRLHASGAERDGHVLVLPGRIEAGKSTLVAGLVRRGWRYVTDEAIALDPDTLAVHPYPKPLAIDPGSWEVLADLNPGHPPGLAERLPKQWQVAPETIRADAVSAGGQPRLVVFPSYEPGAATSVEPISRADTLLELTRCAFEFAPERDLAVLGRLAATSAGYRVTLSDLDAGCEAVESLWAGDATDRKGE